MATYGPPVPVDGPPPVPARFSILSVGRQLDEAEEVAERKGIGVHVEPYPPDLPRGFDPCSTGTSRDKALPDDITLPLFAGFTAYVPIQCSRKSVGDDARFKSRAMRALEARDAYILERQLVGGVVMPLNPYVGDADANILNGTGVNPDEALSLLEEAIADRGQRGVIIATPGTIARWGFDKLRVEGDRLSTAAGTYVISSQGAKGVLPANDQGALAADQQWAWAIGDPFYWRGDVHAIGANAAQSTDRAQNVTTYYGERNLVVGWDKQLQAAVLVDRVS